MIALVDRYIEALPDHKQEMAQQIRAVIMAVPGVEEKLSFKIPFYHYFGMLCYINETKNGLDIGFCRGKDLVLAFPQLEMRDRTMVASVEVKTKADIYTFDLPQIILAAAAWNEEAYQLKKPFVKKSTNKKKLKMPPYSSGI
jgi:hypothetical protein